jgi:hypothetical protein
VIWQYAQAELGEAGLQELLDAAAELDAYGLANTPEDGVAALSTPGQAIYAKLAATGMPHARVLKFARNAEKTEDAAGPGAGPVEHRPRGPVLCSRDG